jgi:predicted metallopeptidase
MARRGKHWKAREDYRPLLKRVKKLFPETLGHVKLSRIKLFGFSCRSSGHMAKIMGNRPPWSLINDEYDYTIVFHSTKFDKRPKSYRLYVVLHELVHIPEHGQVKGHPEYRRCVKHDIQDFKKLRSVYGVSLENVRDIFKGEEGLK